MSQVVLRLEITSTEVVDPLKEVFDSVVPGPEKTWIYVEEEEQDDGTFKMYAYYNVRTPTVLVSDTLLALHYYTFYDLLDPFILDNIDVLNCSLDMLLENDDTEYGQTIDYLMDTNTLLQAQVKILRKKMEELEYYMSDLLKLNKAMDEIVGGFKVYQHEKETRLNIHESAILELATVTGNFDEITDCFSSIARLQ
jgi:hypothetical protein